MRTIAVMFMFIAPTQLSESDRVRAELHQVKVQLLSAQEQLVACQVTLQKASLTDEQSKLEARFREILKPVEGSTWNWQTLAFEAK